MEHPHEMARADSPTAGASPIFLLSFRHRDALAAAVDGAGWTAIAARRADAAERRFVGSGAAVALVDARDAFDAGLAAVRTLGEVVEANAAALLVLVARDDVEMLDDLFVAGATHFLMSPFGAIELREALRFAARHAERLAGGHRAARDRVALVEGEAESWRWRAGGALIVGAALARRLGVPEGRLSVMQAARRLGPEGLMAARSALTRLLYERKPTAFAHDVPGGRIAHHLHLDADDAVIGRIEELEDAPERDRRSRDALTGLLDAAGLKRWIDSRRSATAESVGGQPGCILILIALGRFEVVNAAYGAAAGDALLRGIARRIERLLGEGAYGEGAGGEESGGEKSGGEGQARAHCIARIGGTEFAVSLEGAALNEATGIADDLAAAITRPFAAGERAARLSCHIGMTGAEDDDDAETMLRRAGAALAQAKAGDAGAIRVMDASGEAAAVRRSRLEEDLRGALARDEIGLLFQPQVSIATGEIVGVEALARWRHPEFGSLGAVTLFSVAERSDFLLPLSEHVQRKALAQAAAWGPALATLRMAVNVTASDVAQPGFAARFLAMVDASGFPRDRLTVELTESGLIEDLAEAAGLLANLRAAGLRVAVDDFGTGYSSLAYLKALPLDYLKIDKRLADDIGGSPRDRVVVRGVIEMARSLGLSVIAEGVETEGQLALLAAEGCNYYQGYLCAPAVDAATLARLVAQAAAGAGCGA